MTDRRSSPRPDGSDRRRPSWDEFRRAYPGLLWTLGIALLLLAAFDIWLLARRNRYLAETARLRTGMTEVERRRTDLLLASEESRVRVMLELLRRQAAGDRDLHLSVSLDSGIMYLEQEGASLRAMAVDVGPERRVGTPPDTVHMAAPRGVRTVARVLRQGDSWEVPEWVFAERGLAPPVERRVPGALGESAIVLEGGTVIYALPAAGPLADSAYILPGSIRTGTADLRAVMPTIAPGMKVYLY